LQACEGSAVREPDFLWINSEEITASKAGAGAFTMAFDLIYVMYWPCRESFHLDAAEFCRRANPLFPRRQYTVDLVGELWPEASDFFTELPDGRLYPSLKYFSDANPYGAAQ
jgi:hypothetical protein